MTSKWAAPRQLNWSNTLVLSIALVAFFARLYGIGDKPLWYDEILTLKRSMLPFTEVAADSFRNKHYPTYFMIVRPFAGTDWMASGLRLPSAVFGALCAALAARIAFQVAGRWAALTAGLIMALSPLEVQFGQEARAYTLASAAILLSLWGLLGLVSSGNGTPLAANSRRRRLMLWLCYAVGTSLALNTLSVAVPWLLAANAAVLILWSRRLLPTDWEMPLWGLVNVAVLVSWLPALLALVDANKETPLQGLTWIPELSFQLFGRVVGALYLLRISDMMTLELLPTAVPGLGIAVLVLAMIGGWKLRSEPAMAIVLIISALAMPLALLAVSAVHPMFLPRYLLWSTGPYFILAGIGAAALPIVARRLAATGLIVVAAISLLPYYTTETKPRWDLAADHLAANAGPTDAVVVSSGLARVVLRTYLDRFGSSASVIVRLPFEQDLEKSIAASPTVWLVHGRAGQGVIVPRDRFLAYLSGVGEVESSLSFGKHITVWRINRAGNRNVGKRIR